jgi:hypothetical protein
MAERLGLTIPERLLATTDEVIQYDAGAGSLRQCFGLLAGGASPPFRTRCGACPCVETWAGV